MMSRGFTLLLQVDPVSVLEAVFPKLRPSGSVVIYGPHMEVTICVFSP